MPFWLLALQSTADSPKQLSKAASSPTQHFHKRCNHTLNQIIHCHQDRNSPSWYCFIFIFPSFQIFSSVLAGCKRTPTSIHRTQRHCCTIALWQASCLIQHCPCWFWQKKKPGLVLPSAFDPSYGTSWWMLSKAARSFLKLLRQAGSPLLVKLAIKTHTSPAAPQLKLLFRAISDRCASISQRCRLPTATTVPSVPSKRCCWGGNILQKLYSCQWCGATLMPVLLEMQGLVRSLWLQAQVRKASSTIAFPSLPCYHANLIPG